MAGRLHYDNVTFLELEFVRIVNRDRVKAITQQR